MDRVGDCVCWGVAAVWGERQIEHPERRCDRERGLATHGEISRVSLSDHEEDETED